MIFASFLCYLKVEEGIMTHFKPTPRNLVKDVEEIN